MNEFSDNATIESLEGRRLMSGTTLHNGVLTMSGLANTSNTLSVRAGNGQVHAVVNGRTQTFAAAGVRSVTITGGSRNDSVTVDRTVGVPVSVKPTAGVDTVNGRRTTGAMTLVGTSAVGNAPAAAAAVTVASLSLVDADTGKVVPGYADLSGTVALNLKALPKNLSVQANLSGGTSTVRFDLDGRVGYRVEKNAPYALGGDTAGKFLPIKFSVGTHTLSAGTIGGGTLLSGRNVTLKVTNAVVATTPVKTTPPVKTTNPGNTPATDAAAPVAAIKAIETLVPAGTAVHVDALSSQLKNGAWQDGQYAWDFGDRGSVANAMRGFNAAHVYDTPGTYAVKLTVTNAAGKSNTTTATITVTAANRRVIHVAANGNDANDGTADRPVKSLAKAAGLVADDTEIRFRRGDTFAMTESFRLDHNNVVVSAYGSGKQPRIVWTGRRNNDIMFFVPAGISDVTVQDLSIDTVYDDDTNDVGTPMAFRMGGTNFTARRNTILNVQHGFLLNMNPTGVLIQNNDAPLQTGIRKYFVWAQGNHITIEGNHAANSTREHIVRVNFVSMLNVSGNDFANISRRDDGDWWDYRKTAINIQTGEFAYAYDNKLDGSLQVGPLGKENGNKGMNSAANRFKYMVGEGNEVTDDQIVVNHGAEHVTLRDNVIHGDDALAFNVSGYDTTYKRGVADLNIHHNTVVNDGTRGTFLRVYGSVAGIRLTDNVYVAPNLNVGAYETAAVKLEPGALDSFTEIDGNVWPIAKAVNKWVGEAAMNHVGGGYTLNGFKTAAEWNALTPVGDDDFENVRLTDSYGLIHNGVRVGAKLAA